MFFSFYSANLFDAFVSFFATPSIVFHAIGKYNVIYCHHSGTATLDEAIVVDVVGGLREASFIFMIYPLKDVSLNVRVFTRISLILIGTRNNIHKPNQQWE
jgi:hypothetical protein